MALRHFPGMTQDWLEKKLRAIYEASGSGQRTISGGAGDLTSSVMLTESTAHLVERLSHDLRIVAPSSLLINQTPIPTRTVAYFGNNAQL
tara:strand:+ start:74 stop:343 length:270 start_codon:yes stop_codon:yes gene_type:complete